MASIYKRRIFIATVVAGIAGALAPALSAAQEWPAKPIKLFVPFPPGAGADAMGRLIGKKLGEQLDQTVIVDNKPGATGTICSAYIAKAEPDGYTLILAHVSANAIGPLMVAKGRFDPVKDFTPIAQLGTTPHVLALNPKLPFKTVPELIAFAKANPGKLTYMSSGIGSAQHLAAETFKALAGVDMLHVPFKGSGQGMAALLSGDVDMTFSTTGTALPHVKAGKLRALAVASPSRLPQLPDVPAIAETLKGYEAMTWYGIAGPAKLPPAVVERLEKAIQAVLQQPDVRERLESLDAVIPVNGSADKFAKFWSAEVSKYQELITRQNLKAD